MDDEEVRVFVPGTRNKMTVFFIIYIISIEIIYVEKLSK